MAKMIRKSNRANAGLQGKRSQRFEPPIEVQESFRRRNPRDETPFEAKTERQADYAHSIQNNILTFGIGPAGTGKTYVAGVLAAEALLDGRNVIVTRPACEAGESLGFLPGEMDEKFDPYFRPFRAVLERRLGKSQVEGMMKSGRIEALPLAYMRGHTFDDAFVVLDEAQNTTPVQMKMFLTRIGKNATVVVNGDVTQKDIPGPSGLADAVDRLDGLEGAGLVEFTRADVVRSGIVQRILDLYAH